MAPNAKPSSILSGSLIQFWRNHSVGQKVLDPSQGVVVVFTSSVGTNHHRPPNLPTKPGYFIRKHMLLLSSIDEELELGVGVGAQL